MLGSSAKVTAVFSEAIRCRGFLLAAELDLAPRDRERCTRRVLLIMRSGFSRESTFPALCEFWV